MSRKFDHGKTSYGKKHRAYPYQETCHRLPDFLLQHYGVSDRSYKAWSEHNYRMGDSAFNGRDKSVDYQLRNEIFHSGGQTFGDGYYNSGELREKGINNQQQLDRIGVRFDAAKAAYAATGQNIYLTIQKDLRRVAENYLDADLRQFRLSNK
jgi:cell division protein FtsI/penicillin-binding protein 2